MDRSQGPKSKTETRLIMVIGSAATLTGGGRQRDCAAAASCSSAAGEDHLPCLRVVATAQAPSETLLRGTLTADSELVVSGRDGTPCQGEILAAIERLIRIGNGTSFLLPLAGHAAGHTELVLTNVVLHELVLRRRDPGRGRASFLPSSSNAQIEAPVPHTGSHLSGSSGSTTAVRKPAPEAGSNAGSAMSSKIEKMLVVESTS